MNNGWLPIESAPSEADSLGAILVVTEGEAYSYHVAYAGWTDDDGSIAWFNGDVRVYPTHWQPLPAPPAS